VANRVSIEDDDDSNRVFLIITISLSLLYCCSWCCGRGGEGWTMDVEGVTPGQKEEEERRRRRRREARSCERWRESRQMEGASKYITHSYLPSPWLSK